MKVFTFIIFLLFCVNYTSISAQGIVTVEANPINVAVMLMQRTDTISMASACQYYGYSRQPPQDGYSVFTHPNGSIIRYKYTDPNQPFPTVEVTSKVPTKEEEQILQGLRFEKVGNVYEQKKSLGYITRCTFGPRGTLILTRVMTARD